MRVGRKGNSVPAPAHSPKALTASAMRITNTTRLEGLGWRDYRFGDITWQTEAWRLYDVIGELRFVANWIGSACSRVRIYVAEVDKNGRVQKEVTNKKIAGLADSLFGGPPHKAEAVRLLGINLTVAGDAYIIGKGKEVDSDEWYVLSASEIRRYTPSTGYELISYDSEPEYINPDEDVVIRVWTPHPRRGLWSDSPTRGAMPMLWEIERLTRYVFAQIDSRLVSAGLLAIPKESSFPDEDVEIPGAEGLANLLMKVGSAGLKGEGSAAGVMPTVMEVPTDALGKLQYLTFASELSQQALELRAEALRRFALAMDIDPSILSGAGEANHWGAWQIMEGQINVHIVPLMIRLCDALTTAYLIPALKKIKEDPDRYVFWYDTAPLTVRPERLKETREMYDAGLVSADTVRLAGDYKISDAPSDEEDLEKFTRELMLRDPNLFQIPAVRKVAGYTDDILPPDTVVTVQQPGQPGAGPPPPPPPPTGISPTPGGPMPVETVAQNAPGGPPAAPAGTPAALTASASDVSLFTLCNATVYRALELAGKRLAGNVHRQQFSVPNYEIHTLIEKMERVEKLTAGAWDHFAVLLRELQPGADDALILAIQGSLEHYCAALLDRRRAHQPSLLHAFLTQKGFLSES